ncbi:S-norcoclaurine synthase 1 [Musa troglodytarum]|uniref:S-norcoclaurine synthase 1 n=1 Tax=Musa troglodytarum TaxID=320322 RepID=A0A9E7JHY5_9LILI|nr:S-norcoclaurine synthase 1 [Musa troglodytarum]
MAKPSFQRLGTSIDVPNVQALAASIANPADVPPRYVRPEAKADPVVSDGDSELPVIDFSRLLHRGFSREESAKLHHACADWGFFQLKSVAGTLLEVMAKNLGVAPEEFSTIFQDEPQGVRINYYPPCPRADEVLGLSPHTDGSGLTLLLQVTDVEGLQIRKGGNWFPLINHGVPDQAMEKMKADIVEFFKLPLEEKKAFAQLPNSLEGYGQAFVVSDDQKLDWADMMYLITRPLQSRNVDLWPSQPLTFRLSLCYSMELKSVAGTLLEVMAKNLGSHRRSSPLYFRTNRRGDREGVQAEVCVDELRRVH